MQTALTMQTGKKLGAALRQKSARRLRNDEQSTPQPQAM